MPRIMRHIHEYYENRVVWGLNFSLIDDELSPGKKAILISVGGGVVNNVLVETISPKILRASDFIDYGLSPAADTKVGHDRAGKHKL